MLLFMFIILAGCAVKCDETRSDYYVIEIPDSNPLLRSTKKLFNVYWNAPTKQCRSKKVIFENLFENYGIIQNKNDSFRGEKITILYDPGEFPALFKNANGDTKYRNGGVPQEGSLDEHLTAFSKDLDISIPDQQFDGIGIIDFESWRPVFRQNFGTLTLYQEVSIEIEKKKHWWWKKEWLRAEAKSRFEEAARLFMQRTLALAKKLRPKAKWGYYGFPYCFNMANNHMDKNCAKGVSSENDQMSWMWEESTALFPSVYSPKSLSSSQLTELITGRVNEANRVRKAGTLILPYFWYKYRDGGFLREDDLNVALKSFYHTKTSGFIIWGSSNDVNTIDKCTKLYKNLESTLGPALAKYTKHTRLQDEPIDETSSSNETNINKDYDNTAFSNLSTEDHKYSSYNTNKEILTTTEINNQLPPESTVIIKNNKKSNYSILVGMILNSVTNYTSNQEISHDRDEIIKDENEDFVSPEEAALYDKPFINISIINSIMDTTTLRNNINSSELVDSRLRYIYPITTETVTKNNTGNDSYIHEKSIFNAEEYLIPILSTTTEHTNFATTTDSGLNYDNATSGEKSISLSSKKINVYWNVPTKQCASKKIPFNELFESYGIIQNAHDSFRGEKITILYDPGQFPALFKTANGDLKFRNGGVPQEGSLDDHLTAFSKDLDNSIPDQQFDGVGIIDFESWRPVFIQNFGTLALYQNVSIEIERMKHWWWKEEWLKAEAKSRFEEAARLFMQTTLALAKKLRPNAKWGYYGFPYCFNMANNHMDRNCAKGVPKENDRISWLWEESTALFPSVYSSQSLTSSQLAELIIGRVNEASRIRKEGTPILPYFWFKYRDGGFLKEEDLDVALKSFYQTNSSGFIIWGSSDDVNTINKCTELHMNLKTTLGPAIAKYTKDTRLHNEFDIYNEINIIKSFGNITTIIPSTNNKYLISDNALIETTENSYQTSTKKSFETKSEESNDNLLFDILLYQLTKNTSMENVNRTRDEIVKNENEDDAPSLEETSFYSKGNDASITSHILGTNQIGTTTVHDSYIPISTLDTTTFKDNDFSMQLGLSQKKVNQSIKKPSNGNTTENYLHIDDKTFLNPEEATFSSERENKYNSEITTHTNSQGIDETSTETINLSTHVLQNYFSVENSSLHSTEEISIPQLSSMMLENSSAKPSSTLGFDIIYKREQTENADTKINENISTNDTEEFIKHNTETYLNINEESTYKTIKQLSTGSSQISDKIVSSEEDFRSKVDEPTTINYTDTEINKTSDEISTQTTEQYGFNTNETENYSYINQKTYYSTEENLISQSNSSVLLESFTTATSELENEFNSGIAKTNAYFDIMERNNTSDEYFTETSDDEIEYNKNNSVNDTNIEGYLISHNIDTTIDQANNISATSEIEDYTPSSEAKIISTYETTEINQISEEFITETSHKEEVKIGTNNTENTIHSNEDSSTLFHTLESPSPSESNTTIVQTNYTTLLSDLVYKSNDYVDNDEMPTYDNENIQAEASTKLSETSTTETIELEKYNKTTTDIAEVQNVSDELIETFNRSTNNREFTTERVITLDMIDDDTIFMEDNDFNSTSLIPSISSASQMATSATHLVLRRKYLTCILFFLYTVSKCLCDIYEECS